MNTLSSNVHPSLLSTLPLPLLFVVAIIVMLLPLYSLNFDGQPIASAIAAINDNWSKLGIKVNDDLSIMLSLPDDWKVEKRSLNDNIQNAITISPPTNLPSLVHQDKLSVGIEELEDSKIDSFAYSISVKEILSSRLVDFELIDSLPINITDLQGERLMFNHNVNGKTLRVLQTWVIDDETAFILTFATTPERFEYYNPIINKIIYSLDIIWGQNEVKDNNNNNLLPNSSDNYSIYKSELGFELSYPNNWTIDEGNNRVSFMSTQTDETDTYLERLDIYYNIISNDINNLTSSPSSTQKENEKLSVQLLDEIEYLKNNLQDLNIISINNFQNENNASGKEVVYTYISNGVQTKVYEFLLVGNSNFIIMTFSTNILDSNYDGDDFISTTLEIIVNSFRFLNR